MNMGLMDILGQYESRGFGQPVANSPQHFEEAAAIAPPAVVSDGLAHAFRDESTPPFGQMVAGLFDRSNPQQRAGVLNQILGSLGPAVLSGIANGPLGDMLRRAGAGGTVSPDQASTVTPDEVRDVAEKAEKHNPNIVDKISDFYTQHPGLVRTLGTAALTVALARMQQRSR